MDIRLRLTGLVLLGASALSIQRLVALAHHPGGWSSAIAFGLAFVGFLAGSAGAMLVSTGAHIFDQVAVSERWQRR